LRVRAGVTNSTCNDEVNISVEDAWDDVVGAEFIVGDRGGDRVGGR
jgi:hypothetical protein